MKSIKFKPFPGLTKGLSVDSIPTLDKVQFFITGYNSTSISLDFHDVKKLCNWLDDWHWEQRKRCDGCQHERDGCLRHDH